MDLAQRNRIIKRYLKEKSVNPSAVALQDGDLAPYAKLALLLDHIAAQNQGVFNLATMEANDKSWKRFKQVLEHAVELHAGSPPKLNKCSNQRASNAMNYLSNKHVIETLPKDNYYARPVNSEFAMRDRELDGLIGNCRTKLYNLTQTAPGATAFDPRDVTQINSRIELLEGQIQALAADSPDTGSKQKQLAILTDLKKIAQLTRISIPQDSGPPAIYCTLAEATAGVTEKVSLMSLNTVKTQLRHLDTRAGVLTIDNYSAERDQYKLSTQAIIKLPKHGEIKEVQREAMALNISRMLRRDDSTSRSTTVTYDGHPALFVPFAEIRLLSEFATGKTFTSGLGLSGDTYTHYSTIKPVGEGLQADQFIEDFGNMLDLLYACGDPDAIGGYCQNKALRDARTLFIFDQVIMDGNKFILDSRMSLQPDAFFMKHSRHGKGRNRTLIEDSSMESKYASIMRLKTEGPQLIQYITHVEKTHVAREKYLTDYLQKNSSTNERSTLTTQLKDVIALKKDAATIKTALTMRINAIDEVLPKTRGAVRSEEVRQALIMEKLLHNPRLYSDDGRPYKNPWTERQKNNVKQVEVVGENKVQLTFSAKVPEEMVAFIKRRGGGASISITSPKVITMSRTELAALRETTLHPEHQRTIAHHINYLDPRELALVGKAYGEGKQEPIMEVIAEYQRQMQVVSPNPAKKLAVMQQTHELLHELMATAKDNGFGKHLLKKFHFDAQQKLQSLMNPLYKPVNIDNAFAAALKLDRVTEFNAVVAEAIKLNKVNNPQFTNFLNECIRRAGVATNHIEAQRESGDLVADAQQAIHQLNAVAPVPASPLAQLMAPAAQKDRLLAIDPLTELERELSAEYNVLMAQPKRTTAEQPTVAPIVKVTHEPTRVGITIK